MSPLDLDAATDGGCGSSRGKIGGEGGGRGGGCERAEEQGNNFNQNVKIE